jgi:hypothetical protein
MVTEREAIGQAEKCLGHAEREPGFRTGRGVMLKESKALGQEEESC